MKNYYLILVLCSALFSAKAQQVTSFDDVELEPGSFYNGSDGAGGFTSGGFWFPNDYNTDWGSWSGFSVSNTKDTITAGYENQYSAITGGGSSTSENYAVVYWPGELKMEFDSAVEITGFGVTNSTLAYLTMRDGDSNGFSKKFGGTDETDPDYLKLLVWGTDSLGNTTDTVEFYLADYRYDNSEEDYLINSWEWVDLTSLGAVKKLHFGMESSDTGDYGINTPTYFCIDNFTAGKLTSSFDPVAVNKTELLVYPNPVKDEFFVEFPEKAKKISVADNSGRILYRQMISGQQKMKIYALKGLGSGVYFLKVETESGIITRKILKN
jgi:hypothetical protein